jgi:hypothetical protein
MLNLAQLNWPVNECCVGEGVLNTLGGLRPNTVVANITGDLKTFWKVLNDDGYILNWSGEVTQQLLILASLSNHLCLTGPCLLINTCLFVCFVLFRVVCAQISPVVHQLDHFLEELEDIVDKGDIPSVKTIKYVSKDTAKVDRGWQALTVARCLWSCADSPTHSLPAAQTAQTPAGTR